MEAHTLSMGLLSSPTIADGILSKQTNHIMVAVYFFKGIFCNGSPPMLLREQITQIIK